jgi:hypothetical protein
MSVIALAPISKVKMIINTYGMHNGIFNGRSRWGSLQRSMRRPTTVNRIPMRNNSTTMMTIAHICINKRIFTNPVDHANAYDKCTNIGHEEEKNEAENNFAKNGYHGHVGTVMFHREYMWHETIVTSDYEQFNDCLCQIMFQSYHSTYLRWWKYLLMPLKSFSCEQIVIDYEFQRILPPTHDMVTPIGIKYTSHGFCRPTKVTAVASDANIS